MNPTPHNANSDDQQKPLPIINTNTPFSPDSTPEEDLAALQAIGALEAEDNPSNADLFAEKEEKKPAVALQPIEKEVIIEKKPEPVVIPVPKREPQPEAKPVYKPEPVALISDFKPDGKPKHPISDIASTSTYDSAPLSAALAGVLKEDPAPLAHQVKVAPADKAKKDKKASKKPVIILVVLLFVAAALTGAYFAWQSMQNNTVQQTPTAQTSEVPAAPAPTSTDTQGSVTEAANTIDSYANGLSESIYEDSSLSDATLYAN
jgi:hypothetical protein